MKKMTLLGLVLLLILSFAAGLVRGAVQVPGDVPDNIKVLFQKHCVSCHSGHKPPHGLSWEADKISAAVNAQSQEVPALKIIDTGNPDASYLLKKVLGGKDVTGRRMPPGKHLAATDIDALKAWIASLKTN